MKDLILKSKPLLEEPSKDKDMIDNLERQLEQT